jgi:hypothetical protein
MLAVTSWLLSLLLIARTATNLLAMLTSRFPRAGQLLVGVAGLTFYGLFQFAVQSRRTFATSAAV